MSKKPAHYEYNILALLSNINGIVFLAHPVVWKFSCSKNCSINFPSRVVAAALLVRLNSVMRDRRSMEVVRWNLFEITVMHRSLLQFARFRIRLLNFSLHKPSITASQCRSALDLRIHGTFLVASHAMYQIGCDFLPRDAMHKRGICRRVVSVHPSVRPSVCLSHSCILSKRSTFFTVG